MEFHPPSSLTWVFKGVLLVLLIAGGTSIGYAGWSLWFAPHPGTSPKLLNSGVELIEPAQHHITTIVFSLKTFDVFADFHPFNLTAQVSMVNLQDIKDVYLVLVPASFNSSILTNATEITQFISAANLAGAAMNITSVGIASSITYKATFSISEDSPITVVGFVLLKDGTYEVDVVNQTLVTIEPYSSVIDVQNDHLVASNLVLQTAFDYTMLGLTLVVTAFTMAQVVKFGPRNDAAAPPPQPEAPPKRKRR